VNKALASVDVLLVEDDEDAGELLALALASRGATVRVAVTGANAMLEIEKRCPDVVVCDLSLPDGSGLEWLPKFRGVRGAPSVRAIALSGNARPVDREDSLAAGFEKHLAKPAQIADIVSAIVTLVPAVGPRDLHSMLSRLASLTECRFTSLLRFEADELVSVWTYDRDRPSLDPFPLGLPIEASYCILVKRLGEMVAIENALHDSRADGHPKQRELSTYVAAPVFTATGEMFGTLCCYDAEPRMIDPAVRAAIAAAARDLEVTLQREIR